MALGGTLTAQQKLGMKCRQALKEFAARREAGSVKP